MSGVGRPALPGGGDPGRVVRELADDELPRVEGMFRNYLELARSYRKLDV